MLISATRRVLKQTQQVLIQFCFSASSLLSVTQASRVRAGDWGEPGLSFRRSNGFARECSLSLLASHFTLDYLFVVTETGLVVCPCPVSFCLVWTLDSETHEAELICSESHSKWQSQLLWLQSFATWWKRNMGMRRFYHHGQLPIITVLGNCHKSSRPGKSQFKTMGV